MGNHNMHNDSGLILNAISKFREEHKNFIIPIIFLNDENELEAHLQTPICYETNCNEQYTFKQIKEALKDEAVLTADINSIKAALEEYPEEFKSKIVEKLNNDETNYELSLIHICRCRRYAVCRSRWSPYH
eukprot:TRINITY_DN7158_c0_g1_i27.p1 TRINITY_DN7158_c0_g1~~TRINITY_DN7158_c0_g1_i27.p1  ORF type:complete len:131 (-),score=27.67 TRINITY_DN7158_c0_g1_i27:16-408(-)